MNKIDIIPNNIYNMDCLEGMKLIPDKSIDCIICDLPYGTLACKWDVIIPFDKLWEQYERIIKDNGVIVLFGNEPFTSLLIASNTKLYRYSWVWKKEGPTGFLNSKYRPLQITEDIAVFSKAKVGSLAKNPIIYHPPGLIEINVKKKNNPNSTWRENKGYTKGGNVLNSDKEYTQKYTGYPNNILEFPRDKNAIHETQKPVKLIEYLIETYTKEGETVLDNCMGSGTTAIACINTGRNYIGFELSEDYYNKATNRINQHLAKTGGVDNE